jgi:hypothetical protein
MCPKINDCYKIKMILDKDMCDFQYSDSIKAVCKICHERSESTNTELLVKIERVSQAFYAKYAGKGLTPSEVLELHKSEYWEIIEQLIKQRIFREADRAMDELFRKGVSSFKYKEWSYSEGSYFITFPYDAFMKVQELFN